MADIVTLNGVNFIIPTPGEVDWGQNVTDFLVAIPNGILQKTGGAFPLTADANFGLTFGLISPYYKSTSANIASAGVIRLANIDNIEWRNAANTSNNFLGVNSSDQLTYNGTPLELGALPSAEIFVGNASNVAAAVPMTGDIGITNTGVTSIQAGAVTNAKVNAAAAIAYSKLNLTGMIINNDIGSSAAIVYSKLALTNSILNTDISASAAIAYSKLNLAGSVKLVSDVTGILPTINGGTGVSSLGNLTDTGTDGIVVTGGSGAVITSASLAQHVADTTHNGYLASTDWNTFNGKQASGSYITALTGDVTATGPGSVAATLATVNSNVGSFTAANITVNAKGLITAASNGSSGGSGTVNTGTAGQIAYYASSTNAVSGNTPLTISGTSVSLIGTSPVVNIIGSGITTASLILAANSLTNQIATSSDGSFSIKDQDNAVTILSYSRGMTSASMDKPLILKPTANQLVLGITNTTTISAAAPSSSQTVTIPDPGAAANFILSKGSPTMGTALAMGSNKITGLANGTASTDAMAFGQNKVVQIVNMITTTGTSTASTSNVATNVTLAITPTSASNKVLITVFGSLAINGTVLGSAGIAAIYRGVTDLTGGAEIGRVTAQVVSTTCTAPLSLTWLDAPATTSSTTYTIYIRSGSASDTASYPLNGTYGGITLMEVVA